MVELSPISSFKLQTYLEDKEGNSFASEKEGVEKIADGRYVIEVSDSQLFGYLNTNPTDQKLHFFGHSGLLYTGLIFQLNSPLVPIFKHSELYIRERGMEQQLQLKWAPNVKGSGSSLTEKIVLTGGQTFVIFMILLGAFGVALLFLFGEMIFMKFKNQKRKRRLPSKPEAEPEPEPEPQVVWG